MTTYKIAHLSDIHICDPYNNIEKMINETFPEILGSGVTFSLLRNIAKNEAIEKLKQLFPRLSNITHYGTLILLLITLITRIRDLAVRATFLNKDNFEIRNILWEDLKKINPDHIIITGDITLTSSTSEYEQIVKELKPFWHKLSVVPGNHDVPYLKGSSGNFLDYFKEIIPKQFSQDYYPYLKDITDEISIIGLNSTLDFSNLKDPKFIFMLNSRGIISEKQLSKMKEILSDSKIRSKFKIVILHHHLINRVSPRKYIPSRIYNIYMGPIKNNKKIYKEFCQMGINLILYGHQHRRFEKINFGEPYLFCAGSATTPSPDNKNFPSYNIYTFEKGKFIKGVSREFRKDKITEIDIF